MTEEKDDGATSMSRLSKTGRKGESKSVVLGRCDTSLGILKETLSKFKDDARVEIKLCLDEEREDDYTVDRLKAVCNTLLTHLLDARKCVEMIATDEKNLDENLMYYDKANGFNEGARGLLRDIDAIVDAYYKTMVQIDLER